MKIWSRGDDLTVLQKMDRGHEKPCCAARAFCLAESKLEANNWHRAGGREERCSAVLLHGTPGHYLTRAQEGKRAPSYD